MTVCGFALASLIFQARRSTLPISVSSPLPGAPSACSAASTEFGPLPSWMPSGLGAATNSMYNQVCSKKHIRSLDTRSFGVKTGLEVRGLGCISFCGLNVRIGGARRFGDAKWTHKMSYWKLL